MDNNQTITGYTAIVLAGDRNPNDPLAINSGAACKALVEIEGEPMLVRVLKTLAASRQVSQRVVSGPTNSCLQSQPTVEQFFNTEKINWLEPQRTPSTSAHRALQSIDASTPVLITTADHPLLTPEIVDTFCAQSMSRELDVSVGLCPYELVKTTFPGIKKTLLKFSDGEYCGCNLFAFLTGNSRQLADDWTKVEQHRKNPLRIIRMLGWISVIRYLTGTLSLEHALNRLSRQLGLHIGAVLLPYPEAAVDVDSVADLNIVRKKLSGA